MDRRVREAFLISWIIEKAMERIRFSDSTFPSARRMMTKATQSPIGRTMTGYTQEGTPGMNGSATRPRTATVRISKNRSMTREEIPVG